MINLAKNSVAAAASPIRRVQTDTRWQTLLYRYVLCIAARWLIRKNGKQNTSEKYKLTKLVYAEDVSVC